MNIRTRGFRSLVLGLLVAAAGLLATPAAFAHGSVSIGIGVPGLSVGYWGGGHGHGYGYVGVGGYYGYGYGPYYGGYAPAYYAPAYYAPAPAYRRCFARPFYDGRGYYHRGYHYSC